MPVLRRVRELSDRSPAGGDYLLTDPPAGDWGRSTVRQVVGAAAYVHTQSSASATWTINHNLGYRPVVHLYDVGGVEIEGDVVHTSPNQVVVYFAVPVAGTARMI